MSNLHKALESLGPRAWDQIPQGEQLVPFLSEAFKNAEFLVNSVPQPPGGDPYGSSAAPTYACKQANAARSAAEIVASPARAPEPSIPDLDKLQKGWGKPIKLAVKDNPLSITVWKMAGHDRHGAWFARRSVHEGIGFDKWRKAMQKEFAESLAVEGGPGAGSIRGIGADRRLEHAATDVGELDVYHLSAQFPGPVAPRDFITCLLTTDTALSDASAAHIDGSKHIPRHHMVVSIPVEHPEAPAGQTPVRGSYESVEMIREILVTPPKSKSTPNLHGSVEEAAETRARGLTVSNDLSDTRSEQHHLHSQETDDAEMNPVEWIMITRSDPGGGIPRFMVERGTPGSIATDVAKFLDWATQQGDTSDPVLDLRKQEPGYEVAEQQQKSVSYNPAEANGHLAGVAPTVPANISETNSVQNSGILAGLTSAVKSYAPLAVTSRLGLGDASAYNDGSDSSSDSDSDDSSDSYQETAEFHTAYGGPRTPDPLDSNSDLSGHLDDSSGVVSNFDQSSDHKRYEREMEKLAQRHQALEEQMERARTQDTKKQEEIQTREQKEQEKQREKMEKDRKKQEEKYQKEMNKLQQRKEKEEKKLEEKRRKARDKDVAARDRREKDEFKRRIEILQRENELLNRQLGDVQRENTLLVRKLGGISTSALLEVRAEAGRGSSDLDRASLKTVDSKKGDEKKGADGPAANSPSKTKSPAASLVDG